MGDHLTLCVDHLVTPQSLQSPQGVEAPGSSAQGFCSHVADPSTSAIDIEEEGENDAAGEEEPLIQNVECRICQEEDGINNLEVPCGCSGSLKVYLAEVCCDLVPFNPRGIPYLRYKYIIHVPLFSVLNLCTYAVLS